MRTVLAKDHFDSDDARGAGIPPARRPDRRDRIQHPKIVVPNLYYFRPCPEFSRTPLFARQFEKVLETPGDVQYHRIHGLTKAGLDPDHYLWIRWTVDGDVKFVDYPHQDYHGQNFWLIPSMTMDNARRHKENYERKLDEHGIDRTSPPPTRAAIARYEKEFKFSVENVVETDENSPVLQFIKGRGYSVQACTTKNNEDTYFDDDKWNLHASGVSFRLRKQSDNTRITLKKRFPAQNKPGSSTYRRIEEEVVISPSEEELLLKGKPIVALPYRLLAYVVPAFEPATPRLKQVLLVKTERKMYRLLDDRLRGLELCFDCSTYWSADGKRRLGSDCELELESKGVPSKQLSDLAQWLEREFGWARSDASKYERGLQMLGIVPTQRKP